MVALSRSTTVVHTQLAALLAAQAQGQGFSASALPQVKFMRSTQHVPTTPITYDPCIVVIARGRKVGRLGEHTFVYDPNNYLVLAVPVPFECETFGTPDEPMLGVSIGVTPALVTELLLQMTTAPRDHGRVAQVAEAAPLDEALTASTVRLLESLQNEDEAQVLGPQLVREIVYRVLCGPLGHTLRELAAPSSHFGQISRVVQRLHSEYARTHDMETLAREAGMSVSTFHAHFKAVTASSPLQYLKAIRLHKARLLMVHDGLSAAGAASEVGYESASQFSREFKRLFGAAPAAVAAQLRANLMRLA